MIDKATVQKIKDAADIVEVVSDYVHLVRRGSNYMGLCPFHNERTPSFSVNKARNFCYCFSCHKGGSPVNFIMEKEGISYHDALLQLAKKYGIKVEEKELTDEEREAMSRREGMYVANEWAMRHFEHNLRETEEGRNVGLSYLYGRGVTEEAIKAFHLGYAIDNGGAFLSEARRKGFNPELLKQLGLVGTSQQGRDYDRFRGRVIFPILNSSGKVIAFGGRDLKGGPAKYINSPESELYRKSNELYGMFQARQAIVKEDRCFLVEGYLDVIGMWQAGLQNTVASSGTALTDGQIGLIHRFTRNVTLIYDGDSAGIKAALRGIDMLLSHQLDVKVLLLPDGDDPDSFARKHSPTQLKEYVDANQTDIIRFKTKILMDESGNDPQKRVEAIRSVVQSLACIPDKVKRDVYVQECSRLLNVTEESISQATARARTQIVEQLARQRNLRQLDRDIDSGRIEPQTTAPAQPRVDEKVTAGVRAAGGEARLTPLEWDVLQYCIRFGFLDFCQLEEADGTTRNALLIEYVDDELAADSMVFTGPGFARVFHELLSMVPQFLHDIREYDRSLDTETDRMRRQGIDDIAAKGLSVAEIRRAEKTLEESLQKFRQESCTEYAKAYPGRILASHEDDSVRRLTTRAMTVRPQLSRIYSRDCRLETEEDKLITLVPTALTVWRNGILESRFKELLREFQAIAGKGDSEKERRMQAQLSDLIRLRSEVAKNIGDRTLSPVRQTAGCR